MTIVDIDARLYDERDNDVYLETYEQYRDIIETTEIDTQEELYAKVRLTSDYAAVLMQKNRYSIALPYITQAIQIWEVYENDWTKPLLKVERYEKLRFLRGVALANLKKQKEARREFEWLVANYPQNELYQNWLQNLKRRWLGQTATAVLLISAASFISRFLFPDSPIADIGEIVFRVSIVIYFGLLAFNYFANKAPKS